MQYYGPKGMAERCTINRGNKADTNDDVYHGVMIRIRFMDQTEEWMGMPLHHIGLSLRYRRIFSVYNNYSPTSLCISIYFYTCTTQIV